MPVRSLSSSVLKWPEAEAVIADLRRWAATVGAERGELLRVGYFGSCARGNWGVGSDLDVILIVESSPDPFPLRAARWDLSGLPVPCDVLVYTREEWERIERRGHGFGPIRWVWSKPLADNRSD